MNRHYFMIMGLFGVFLIYAGTAHDAYAQNMTLYSETLLEMGEFFPKNQINVTYPLIFLVGLILCSILTFRMQREQWGVIFAIMCSLFCIILTFIFLSPYPMVFETEKTEIIINQLNDTVQTTTLHKSVDNAVIFPKDSQFRFIFTSLFMVLSMFYGLISILIVSGIRKGK